MTQTGKCDICRQRKVKCDQEKPKCSACRKKDRPCTYSYGKASAFVVQDPNQLTKHGKSKIAPIVYALESSPTESSSSISTPSDLQITTERDAGNGHGTFQTLTPLSRRKNPASRRTAAYRQKKLEEHLQALLAESAVSTIRPSSSESTLIREYINILGSNSAELQPLSILGTWIQTIPSRIGHNRMIDLAVEFFVNSFAVYYDNSYSRRAQATASKERALKELQLTVLKANSRPTYDVLLATKMHYAAEALMGIDTMYHAIHAFGLAELLKSGSVDDVDDEHYWNLIDNTYIDDVNEAMLAGRISVYDNEFYLTSTFPPPLSTTTVSLSPYQRASMAIMHIFIQCPRLNIMVRKATTNPDNTADLVAAVTMAESLWQLDVAAHVLPLLTSSITAHPTPPVEELADIMTESLSFDSVQNSILCTRYWMLQNILCGFVDTLHRWFPTETALSLLPQQDVLYKLDTDAALQLGQSVAWANSISQKLPLVPLRLHTPLQLSIGPWWRLSRHLKGIRANNPALDPDTETSITFQLDRAERMKAWAIVQCNVIHKQWDVSPVAEKPLMEALNTMAGEKIPEWMPVRVRFEAEDGEMVMKLDYENKTGSYQERFDLSEKPPKSVMARTSTYRALADALTDDAELEGETRELPYRIASPWNPETRSAAMIEQYESNRNTSMQIKNAADFVHATGRNLCSTSGWWPTSDTDDSSRILLDMTHKASTFSKIPRPAEGVEELDNGYEDRHPCLASSFWPQTPNNGPMSRVHTPLSTDVSSMWATSASSSAQGSREKRSSLSPAWTTIEDLTPSSNESPSTQQQEDEIHGALNLKDL